MCDKSLYQLIDKWTEANQCGSQLKKQMISSLCLISSDIWGNVMQILLWTPVWNLEKINFTLRRLKASTKLIKFSGISELNTILEFIQYIVYPFHRIFICCERAEKLDYYINHEHDNAMVKKELIRWFRI